MSLISDLAGFDPQPRSLNDVVRVIQQLGNFDLDGAAIPPIGGLTEGDLLYVNAGGILTRLPIGTVDQVLTVTGGLPVWATPAAAPAQKYKLLFSKQSDAEVQAVNGNTAFTTTSFTYNDTLVDGSMVRLKFGGSFTPSNGMTVAFAYGQTYGSLFTLNSLVFSSAPGVGYFAGDCELVFGHGHTGGGTGRNYRTHSHFSIGTANPVVSSESQGTGSGTGMLTGNTPKFWAFASGTGVPVNITLAYLTLEQFDP